MSLRFILGRAGTGKTTRCLTEISRELERDPAGEAIVLLVPEQATYQTERALLARCRGALRAQVLSFRRLAYRVLLTAGGNLRPHIGEVGKEMVLRALTNRYRDRLRVFGRMAGQSGFGQRLAGALSELKAYRLTPQDLRAAGPLVEESLRDKLADLALLYEGLEDYLAGRYTDPDDYLALLAQRLPLAASLAGASFWVDSFAGFTPAEYLVLEAVLGVAARVTVALCLDPGGVEDRGTEDDIFWYPRETKANLEALAGKTGHVLETPLALHAAPRFAGFPAGGHLERHFFRHPAPAFVPSPPERPIRRQTRGPQPFVRRVGVEKDWGGREGVSLLAAADRRAEVEAVAGEIIRLAREDGLRFREMLVLARDLELYRDLLTSVFADWGIPVFIDYKRPVAGHPLVELIRGALDCALEDWSYTAVFRYLKTGLTDVAPEQVDELENCVLAYGIRGSRWSASWNPPLPADQLLRIDAARRAVAGPLAALHRDLAPGATVRDMTGALYGFLVGLGVPGRLLEWAARLAGEGRLAAAAAHDQIFAAVVDLFDQVVEALGEEEMSLADYASVLADGLADLRLGLVPPGLDQVLAGSLDHSRHPQVRAAFVLGLNEGVLPARPPADGFFTDAEREALAASGVVLAPGARRRLLDEEYLVYVALTRASERLHLGYAMAGQDGAALLPSPVVHRLRELLPGLAGERDEGPAPVPVALSQLAVRLREAVSGGVLDDTWRAVYNWALGHPVWHRRLAALTAALDYRNREEALSRAAGRALFPRPLVTGVSRLEQFRACPFAHFLTYGLRLAPRPVRELAPPDLGRFFHEALYLVGRRLAASSRNWGDLAGEEIAAAGRAAAGELIPALQNELLLSSARYRHLAGKLVRVVERSVRALAEHDRRGVFRPVALEAVFGPGGELPAPLFEADGRPLVELAGRVDRIDWARDDAGRLYVRVIDYKSGGADVSLDDVYQGVRLQLLVYLYVALEHARLVTGGPVRPGGVFYFHVQDPLVAAEAPPEEDAAARLVLREFRMHGLVAGDPAVLRMMDNRLTGGRSDIVPAALRADGGLYGSVLGPREFSALLSRVRELVLATGQQIRDGVVDITPYRRRNTDACRWCTYRPVCRFDPLLERESFRTIPEAAAAEIVARLRGGGADD